MAERRPILAGSPVCWTILKFVVLGPLLRLLFRPRVSGLEHIPLTGGAIVAANHVSFLDPLLLPLVVPRRVMFLAKMKYIDKPLLRWFLRAVGVIPVATDEPGGIPGAAGAAGAAGAVAAGVRAVRDGRLVGIFPEGTRSPDGRLHRGKTGVARIAIQAGVPVIPAGITGTPAWMAILATPVFPRCSRPSGDRVPSGKIPTSRPSRTARTPAATAPAAPAAPAAPGIPPGSSVATGMTPTARRNQRSSGLSMYFILARNITRRGTTSGSSSGSRNDTWLAATIAPPVSGMCSRPLTRGRKSSRSRGPSTTNFRIVQQTGEPARMGRRSAIGLLPPPAVQWYRPGRHRMLGCRSDPEWAGPPE